jgi:predicted 3-demethylubiquinone-9 3-methyltransferase (glyoxalase superfamily)
MLSKNTICLWYDGTALDAAKFYAETFPDSAVLSIARLATIPMASRAMS